MHRIVPQSGVAVNREPGAAGVSGPVSALVRAIADADLIAAQHRVPGAAFPLAGHVFRGKFQVVTPVGPARTGRQETGG